MCKCRYRCGYRHGQICDETILSAVFQSAWHTCSSSCWIYHSSYCFLVIKYKNFVLFLKCKFLWLLISKYLQHLEHPFLFLWIAFYIFRLFYQGHVVFQIAVKQFFFFDVKNYNWQGTYEYNIIRKQIVSYIFYDFLF